MKIKIILGILIVLVVLLVVAVLVVGAHLGDLVKAGLEVGAPKVTQTTLTVDSVEVSLLSGSAGVKGLVLGNPEGYQAPQSISLGHASISLVPGSVLSDKIVIHSIEVQSPEITFEGNPLGANNLTKIMANVDAFTGSGGGSANAAPAASPGGAKPAKKFEVDDFIITGASVHAQLTGLVNRQLTVPLPDIHLTGLGAGSDGITAADLTRKVLSEITADTIKALASSVAQMGMDATGAVKGAASGTVNQLKKGLGGLLGQ